MANDDGDKKIRWAVYAEPDQGGPGFCFGFDSYDEAVTEHRNMCQWVKGRCLLIHEEEA